jgi:hypothetical protein
MFPDELVMLIPVLVAKVKGLDQVNPAEAMVAVAAPAPPEQLEVVSWPAAPNAAQPVAAAKFGK